MNIIFLVSNIVLIYSITHLFRRSVFNALRTSKYPLFNSLCPFNTFFVLRYCEMFLSLFCPNMNIVL